MPKTKKGEKIYDAMMEQYGEKKGKKVYYAYENKNKGKGLTKGKKKAK